MANNRLRGRNRRQDRIDPKVGAMDVAAKKLLSLIDSGYSERQLLADKDSTIQKILNEELDLADELASEDFDKKFVNGYDIVALVGIILGGIAFVASIFGFGIFTFLPGLIVSIVGKKAKKQKKLADYGVLFSILALVIAIALFIFAP